MPEPPGLDLLKKLARTSLCRKGEFMKDLDDAIIAVNSIKNQLSDAAKALNDVAGCLIGIQKFEITNNSNDLTKHLKEFLDIIYSKETWNKDAIVTLLAETAPEKNKLKLNKYIKLEK
jgi:hypothetical protein